MTFAAAAFLVLGFVYFLQRLRVPSRARETFAVTGGAFTAMRDPALSELQKEKAVQAAARRLIVLFTALVGLTAAALGIPLAIAAGVALTGLFDLRAALDATLSWPILAGAALVVVGWAALAKKKDG